MAIVNRRLLYAIAALGVAALIIKLIPLLRFGPFAFGYDSGFYRRYLIEPFLSFPNAPVPGLDHTIFLPRILLDIVRFFVQSPDIVLYGTYIALALVASASVYWFARQYLSERLAVYATLLYLLSGVQSLVYQSFFFKEMLALPLLLFALRFLEKERYGLVAVLGVLIVLTQQTSAILLICIGGLGFLLKTLKERRVSIGYILSGTCVLASYLFLHPHVAQKIASPPVGVFLTQADYLLWSVPILLLAAVGVRRALPLFRQNPVLAAALLVPLLFALFHLPFYNRIYAFLDLFLILPAALGIGVVWDLLKSRSRYRAAFALTLFALIPVPLLYLQSMQTPLVDTQTQEALPSLALLPEGSVVITSPQLLPWVQGWSVASVYAPGNLKEPHAPEDWSYYWTHQDPAFEKEFLASFPRPSYVFAGTLDQGYVPTCATSVNAILYSLESCL